MVHIEFYSSEIKSYNTEYIVSIGCQNVLEVTIRKI